MMTYLAIVLALAVNPPAGFNAAPILDAIEAVETGGHADPANAIGDGGKALGPMQIHKVYWLDAVEHDPSLVANGETYQSVRDRTYARRVVMAYWSRYAKSWTSEELARIHNGGPKGYAKRATLGYWAKVKKALDLTR
jgi:hypothetical protein